MKIAIASDMHFGYAWEGERSEDSFIQGREAIEKCLDSDLIILPGDIFDSRIPKQEIVDRALRTIGIASSVRSEAKIEGFAPERGEMPTMVGTPVVAIHGTHERRAKGLTNPVNLLEAAGLCVALHGDAAILSKGDERVAVHGMGGVPEQYAKQALEACEFKPIPGMKNILVLHQSFREYIYEDAAYLSMEDLPPGFDLYINGHVHWSDIKGKGGKILLHPGSTILTQMRKAEADQEKLVWFYDSNTGEISKKPLSSPRRMHYIELKVSSPQEAVEKSVEALSKIPAGERKPLVKLKLTGRLPPGSSINAREIKSRFPGLIISLDDSLEISQFRKKIDFLRESHSKKSVDELGLAILQKNLEQSGYDGPEAHELLPLLLENREEDASKLILGKGPRS